MIDTLQNDGMMNLKGDLLNYKNMINIKNLIYFHIQSHII